MPITKKLERSNGLITVTDAINGRVLLSISESYQLTNSEVMNLLWSIHARTKSIENAYMCKSLADAPAMRGGGE